MEDVERRVFYSPGEVAELLGLSSDTVLNYIHAKKIFAVKLSERTYRIPVRVVEKLAGGEIRPPRLVEIPTGGRAAAAEFRRRIEETERVPTRS